MEEAHVLNYTSLRYEIHLSPHNNKVFSFYTVVILIRRMSLSLEVTQGLYQVDSWKSFGVYRSTSGGVT